MITWPLILIHTPYVTYGHACMEEVDSITELMTTVFVKILCIASGSAKDDHVVFLMTIFIAKRRDFQTLANIIHSAKRTSNANCSWPQEASLWAQSQLIKHRLLLVVRKSSLNQQPSPLAGIFSGLSLVHHGLHCCWSWIWDEIVYNYFFINR